MTPYNYTGGGTQNGCKSGEEEKGGEEWALFKIKDKSSRVAVRENSHRMYSRMYGE
jgi:hypothetical protein